jgi:hypothetical protein
MNWRQLNARLSSLREDELEQMIQDELKGERRPTLLIRMHQRFTVLRNLRERREILMAATLEADAPQDVTLQ